MHVSLWRKVCKWFALAGLAASAGLPLAPGRGRGARSSAGSMSPSPASATTWSTAGTACSSSTSITATGSSSGSRPPGSIEKGVPINVKGICAAPDEEGLHQHHQATDVHRPGDREARLGADVPRRLRPDGDLARRPGDLCAVLRRADLERRRCRHRRRDRQGHAQLGAHNTIYGLNGAEVYLAGLKSPILSIASTKDHTIARTVGPFSNRIRPFTVNGRQTLCFVNCNELLGFEVGDLKTGKMLHRVEVQGYREGAGQAPRLPESRHRDDPRREGDLGRRRLQPAAPHLRRHGDAAEAGREPQGPRRAGLGHLQHRRPARLSRRRAT